MPVRSACQAGQKRVGEVFGGEALEGLLPFGNGRQTVWGCGDAEALEEGVEPAGRLGTGGAMEEGFIECERDEVRPSRGGEVDAGCAVRVEEPGRAQGAVREPQQRVLDLVECLDGCGGIVDTGREERGW